MTQRRNYARGADLERAIAARLRTAGCPLVIRSAGSHGAVDVLAIGNGATLLIQCKADGYLAPMERAALITLAAEVGAVACVAGRNGPRRSLTLTALGADGTRTELPL